MDEGFETEEENMKAPILTIKCGRRKQNMNCHLNRRLSNNGDPERCLLNGKQSVASKAPAIKFLLIYLRVLWYSEIVNSGGYATHQMKENSPFVIARMLYAHRVMHNQIYSLSCLETRHLGQFKAL